MTTKQNILLGLGTGVVWAIFTGPPIIDLALVLAFFVLVPSLLCLAATDNPKSLHRQRTFFLARYSYPFAFVAMIALSIEIGMWAALLAVVWAFFTLLVAINGGLHLIRKGVSAPEEAVMDAGQMFLFAGGIWFVLARAGAADWMPYSTMTVDLTAIHYHYSAFILPLFAGLFGRWYVNQKQLTTPSMMSFTVLALGLIIGSPLVAIGIAQGPPLEFVMVVFYVVFIFWLCIWVLLNTVRIGGLAGLLAAVATASLLFTMSYTTLHGAAIHLNIQLVPTGEMLRYHGAVNAFVFSVLGTTAWLLVKPRPRYDEQAFPISHLRAKGYVGPNVATNHHWTAVGKKAEGLLANWEAYERNGFSPSRVSSSVKDFYVHTTTYTLSSNVQWRWKWMSALVRPVTTRMGQINLPPTGHATMEGDILAIDEKKDERPDVRAWIRYNKETNDPIFSAFYSSHKSRHVTYMNIALPFPKGVMTGVLRPDNDHNDGLYLTSKKNNGVLGDEGIYFTLKNITVKLPLNEVFHVREEDGRLQATHTMTVFGLRFLTICYEMTKIKT
ncbi:YndJ family protein [Alteribacter aurantiacus]|uniref:YndJ family protein n=1 Tax=Alteribacter aurantiacus TaxID=254410 RepID=UPI000413975E|nr:YndJ family protein [Alteribacter aurantiacus]